MICVSLAEPTVTACLRALEGVGLAEIRLDKMRIGPAGVRKIFSRHRPLVATCRPGGMPENRRQRLLLAAAEAGAAFVDIELETEAAFREQLTRTAHARNGRVIISHHDFRKTPPRIELEAAARRAVASGADIVKIACRVRERRDNARLLGLLDLGMPLIIVGMGKRGRLTRIAAPLLGSLFTYATLGKGKETAEGQMDAASLERLLLELEGYV
jgi:3-dehydroquinate dehydratase type I